VQRHVQKLHTPTSPSSTPDKKRKLEAAGLGDKQESSKKKKLLDSLLGGNPAEARPANPAGSILSSSGAVALAQAAIEASESEHQIMKDTDTNNSNWQASTAEASEPPLVVAQ
jgi:hypothetical protein